MFWVVSLTAPFFGCAVKDPPTPEQQINATMHTCADLGADTLFWFTEYFANGTRDTNQILLSSLDSITYPNGAGHGWQLQWCCRTASSTAEPTLTTALDSAKYEAHVRTDSLRQICPVRVDTLRIDPINRPFPLATLQTIVQEIIDTTKQDSLKLALPQGVHFRVHSTDSSVSIGTRYEGRLRDSLRLKDAFAPTDWDVPKHFHDTPDTLIIPIPHAGHWSLTYNDAYGFVDSVQF